MVVAVPQGAKLVLATHNKGKLAEFREILAQAIADFDPASVISAADLQVPEPVEDGISFAANATIKANALAQATGLPAVADDSGLCVDVLGGRRGFSRPAGAVITATTQLTCSCCSISSRT